MTEAKRILNNSDLLIKEKCLIVDDVLYEKCEFDNNLFTRDEFENTDKETYYLDEDSHVYRFFFSEDDYDYVTDSKMLERLNKLFANK